MIWPHTLASQTANNIYNQSTTYLANFHAGLPTSQIKFCVLQLIYKLAYTLAFNTYKLAYFDQILKSENYVDDFLGLT